MNHSQEIDPEIERTAASIREVVKILREAKDDKTRNTAAAELKKLFEKAFDRDYERRHKELTKLADRVAMLRVQLDRRRESRDDIIDVRVKSLLYEAEGIGFPGDLGLGPPSAAFDAYAPRTRAPWLPPYFPPVPPGSAEPSRNRP